MNTDGLAEFTCGFLTAAMMNIPLKRTKIEVNTISTEIAMTLASGAKVLVVVSVDTKVAA